MRQAPRVAFGEIKGFGTIRASWSAAARCRFGCLAIAANNLLVPADKYGYGRYPKLRRAGALQRLGILRMAGKNSPPTLRSSARAGMFLGAHRPIELENRHRHSYAQLSRASRPRLHASRVRSPYFLFPRRFFFGTGVPSGAGIHVNCDHHSLSFVCFGPTVLRPWRIKSVSRDCNRCTICTC